MVLIVAPQSVASQAPGWCVSVAGRRWELPLACPDMKKLLTLFIIVLHTCLTLVATVSFCKESD